MLKTKNPHQLNKLNELADYGKLELSQEQKSLIYFNRKKAEERAKARKEGKTIDYIFLPTSANTLLESLYDAKYKDKPGNHEFRKTMYRVFLHMVYTTHYTNLLPQEDYQPLNSRILKMLFGKNKTQANYLDIKKDLQEWGFIEIDETYVFNSEKDKKTGFIKEVKSKGYRLTSKVAAEKFSSQRVYGAKYSQKVEEDLGKKTTKLITENETYAWLKRNIQKLTISEKVFDWIDEQVKLKTPLKDKTVKTATGWKRITNRYITPEIAEQYKASVKDIILRYEDKDPTFTVGSTNNRLLTALSNLFSELRSFMIIDNNSERIISIDLASSQVYLLLPLLENNTSIDVNSEDYQLFKKLACGGKFYKNLTAHIEKKFPSYKVEEDAKVNFFKNVIFSTNHEEYGFRKYFNKQFPNVNKGILELVSGNNADNLAVKLQKTEAHLFLDIICGKILTELKAKTWVATLHDSVYCFESDFDEIYNIISEELTTQTGIKPFLKYEEVTQELAQDEVNVVDGFNYNEYFDADEEFDTHSYKMMRIQGLESNFDNEAKLIEMKPLTDEEKEWISYFIGEDKPVRKLQFA